jgi:hypothetical protein
MINNFFYNHNINRLKIHLLLILISPSLAMTKLEWQEFNAATPNWHNNYYLRQQKLGQIFETQGWQQQLAWVKVCQRGFKARPMCHQILKEATQVPALVVRGEAAVTLGKLFAATSDKVTADVLANMITDKRNYRGQKPMFVIFRALNALAKIGGQGHEHGDRLAKKEPNLEAYWGKVRR